MRFLSGFHSRPGREKLLLTILGIAAPVAGCVYVFSPAATEQTMISRDGLPPAPQTKQAVLAEIPVKHDWPAANMKNPFRVPVQERGHKEINQTDSGSGEPVRNSAGDMPFFRGIITRGTDKRAILEWGGHSEALGIGDSWGGYTVTAITGTQVVLTGPQGRRELNIGR